MDAIMHGAHYAWVPACRAHATLRSVQIRLERVFYKLC